MTIEVDAGKINAIHSMLHLIYHRNKNQHGTSKWWKWLSILKRASLKLLKALECDTPYNRPNLPVDTYKEYLAIYAIPRCYLAFSTVVADGQFSTLGIVLLTLLADLASAIKVKLEFTGMPRSEKAANGLSTDIKAVTEDVGEVVCRENEIPAIVTHSDSTVAGVINTETVSTSKDPKYAGEGKTKPAKKKSRKKNTIDDLFNNFL